MCQFFTNLNQSLRKMNLSLLIYRHFVAKTSIVDTNEIISCYYCASHLNMVSFVLFVVFDNQKI